MRPVVRRSRRLLAQQRLNNCVCRSLYELYTGGTRAKIRLSLSMLWSSYATPSKFSSM